MGHMVYKLVLLLLLGPPPWTPRAWYRMQGVVLPTEALGKLVGIRGGVAPLLSYVISV